MKSAKSKFEKVHCPYCGYQMPIKRDKDAVCRGLRVQCKARNCKKEFEIIINSEIK